MSKAVHSWSSVPLLMETAGSLLMQTKVSPCVMMRHEMLRPDSAVFWRPEERVCAFGGLASFYYWQLRRERSGTRTLQPPDKIGPLSLKLRRPRWASSQSTALEGPVYTRVRPGPGPGQAGAHVGRQATKNAVPSIHAPTPGPDHEGKFDGKRCTGMAVPLVLVARCRSQGSGPGQRLVHLTMQVAAAVVSNC